MKEFCLQRKVTSVYIWYQWECLTFLNPWQKHNMNVNEFWNSKISSFYDTFHCILKIQPERDNSRHSVEGIEFSSFSSYFKEQKLKRTFQKENRKAGKKKWRHRGGSQGVGGQESEIRPMCMHTHRHRHILSFPPPSLSQKHIPQSNLASRRLIKWFFSFA